MITRQVLENGRIRLPFGNIRIPCLHILPEPSRVQQEDAKVRAVGQHRRLRQEARVWRESVRVTLLTRPLCFWLTREDT